MAGEAVEVLERAYRCGTVEVTLGIRKVNKPTISSACSELSPWRSRNHQLDGLRGYAAVAVCTFHTILSMDETLVSRILYGSFLNFADEYSWFAKIVLKLTSGETAVFIFFVLSGAVLFQSLATSQTPLGSRLVNFAIRRSFRIFPALIVSLVLMSTCLAALGWPIRLDDFIVNSVLFAFPINGVTWTLNVEIVATGFIAITFLGWYLYREWGLIAVALVLGLILRLPAFDHIAVTFKDNWIFFALGMLIPTRVGRAIAQAMPVGAWSCVLLVAIAFKGFIQPIAIAALVAMIYYNRSGMLGRFLERPFSRFLGRISFSFYLYNPLLLAVLSIYSVGWSFSKTNPIELGLLVSVPIIAATIPLAYLSTRFIEEPCNIWAHRMLKPPVRTPQTAL